ncbi:hypothetical protein ACOKM5_20810 [Streptomyces sp. BH097]|uniref:hypothetical protein n=1 Tax=Streptomyces sp. BH097 TaxID=3410406 RepID=UPI003CEAA44F
MFRIFRRPRPAPLVPEAAYVERLAAQLTERLERWQQHADSYAKQAASAGRERDIAYRERTELLAWLAALHPAAAVITPAADIDAEGAHWHLLYLTAGGWQMRWPVAPVDVPLFSHVTFVEPSDPRAQWDGHGTAQKYQRIRQHVRLLVLEDGALTPVRPEARSA